MAASSSRERPRRSTHRSAAASSAAKGGASSRASPLAAAAAAARSLASLCASVRSLVSVVTPMRRGRLPAPATRRGMLRKRSACAFASLVLAARSGSPSCTAAAIKLSKCLVLATRPHHTVEDDFCSSLGASPCSASKLASHASRLARSAAALRSRLATSLSAPACGTRKALGTAAGAAAPIEASARARAVEPARSGSATLLLRAWDGAASPVGGRRLRDRPAASACTCS